MAKQKATTARAPRPSEVKAKADSAAAKATTSPMPATTAGWEDVGEGEQIRLVNVGDSITGQLVAVDECKLGVNFYRIAVDGGEIKGVLGTTILDRKMEDVDVGDMVYIELTELQKSRRFPTTDMKMFNVRRKPAA